MVHKCRRSIGVLPQSDNDSAAQQQLPQREVNHLEYIIGNSIEFVVPLFLCMRIRAETKDCGGHYTSGVLRTTMFGSKSPSPDSGSPVSWSLVVSGSTSGA